MKPASCLAMTLVVILLTASLSLGIASPAAATAAGPRCYVNASVSGGSGDGSTWANAYVSLQDALGNTACTEVWVAAGIYTPDASLRTRSFVLASGVAVHGGFAGGEGSLNPRDFKVHETILSGDLNRDDLTGGSNSENSYNVVKGAYSDATAVLDGFTIRGGNANGAPYTAGAGVYNGNGNPAFNCGPTLENVIITGNTAMVGGGMYNFRCAPNLSHFRIDHNQSTSSGGGMWNYQSHPTLHNGTIAYNTVPNYGGGIYAANDSSLSITSVDFDYNNAQYGGGIYLNGGSNTSLDMVSFNTNHATIEGGGMDIWMTDPTLNHLTLNSNTASSGAGMSLLQASPHLTNSDFISNVASSNGGGLAIYDALSQPVLNSVTFDSNSAVSGGGILNSAGTLLITDGSFSGNIASGSGGGSGGGILNDSGSLTLTRATFADNHAVNGGGISTSRGNANLTDVAFKLNRAAGGAGLSNNSGDLNLARVTFSENGDSSTSSGGGFYNDVSSAGSADLTNVTFSGNTAQLGGGIYNNGAALAVTNATFDANTASSHGAGLFTQTALTLKNTILWGDADPLYNNGSDPVTIHDSVVQGMTCPSSGLICSNISSDFPYLGPLQNNGGYTETMAITNLLSYAIDHGNNATCAGTDQRGTLRPQDGDHDGNAICDIGSFERQAWWFLYLPMLNR